MQKSERISFVGIFLNTILFVAKIIVGIFSQSTAVISDAINSFTDIFASVFIFVAVKVANKKADEDHPFGHDRAEPIAGFIVAIFTGILSFEIARTSITELLTEHSTNIGASAVAVLLFTIAVKSFMAAYFIKKGTDMKRPAIKATGIDSRNDVLVSTVALIGVIGAMFGYPKLDDIAALIISLFIFYSGYKIGIENIDYLMGKRPPEDYFAKIRKKTLETKGVKGINELNAHYVGNKIHVEIHIDVDENKTTKKSHDIGKEVQRKIEKMPDICRAFIHIDPV
ncbi:cation transporter [Candidatus Woesearchaeota archaeon]|nr:cation transporter [Candidatus Woesearchaeota archaeon]